MPALAQRLEQLAILGIAGAIGAGQRARLKDGLEVVEDQQAAPRAQQLHQQRDLVGQPLGRRGLLVGDRADEQIEQPGQRRRVLQRAEQHHRKLRGDALGSPERQARLADPADAKDA